MVKIAKLIEGYKTFYKKYFIKNAYIYENLVKNGQSPKTLVIACSDSRVDPSIIFNTEPGDIFVIRNVANIVPVYEDENQGYHSTSAAIEYAVLHLKVENIVVLGHSNCGGINALVAEKNNNHTFIDNWLYIVNEAKEIARNLTQNCPEKMCETCAKEAIKKSVANLQTFPFIKNNPNIECHGWYFSLESGLIEIL